MKKILLITIIGTIFLFSDTSNTGTTTPESSIDVQKHDHEKVINSIVPSQYDYASSLEDGYILVSDLKLYGVIDLSQKVILPLEYKSIIYSGQHQVFTVAKEDANSELLWGVIDVNGRITIPIIYNNIINISNSRSEPTAIMTKNSKYGYLNFVTGKVKVEPIYDFLGTDSLLVDKNGEGFLLARKEKKWAVLNTDGELLTPFDFDDFRSTSYNNIVATKNDNIFNINLELASKSILSIEPHEASNTTNFVGIGVYINASAIVEEVVPDSPAKLSGIKEYDKIIKINGIDTSMMTHAQIINAIRGEIDTIVIIDILRDEKPIQFKIKRIKLSILVTNK